jgi:hypothetical protein
LIACIIHKKREEYNDLNQIKITQSKTLFVQEVLIVFVDSMSSKKKISKNTKKHTEAHIVVFCECFEHLLRI